MTTTFDSAVSDLTLHTQWCRGSGGAADRYADDTLSQSFTINAGFTGDTSGNQLTGAVWNADILSFTGPVTTLTITRTAGEFKNWRPWRQRMTFALPAASQAVPGMGGIAAIAGVGLIGGRRRRRGDQGSGIHHPGVAIRSRRPCAFPVGCPRSRRQCGTTVTC